MLIFFDYPKSSWNIYINGTMQTARFSLDKDSAMLYLQRVMRDESMFHDTFFKAIFFFLFPSFPWHRCAKEGKRSRTERERERERRESSRRCAGIGARDNEKEDRVRRP